MEGLGHGKVDSRLRPHPGQGQQAGGHHEDIADTAHRPADQDPPAFPAPPRRNAQPETRFAVYVEPRIPQPGKAKYVQDPRMQPPKPLACADPRDAGQPARLADTFTCKECQTVAPGHAGRQNSAKCAPVGAHDLPEKLRALSGIGIGAGRPLPDYLAIGIQLVAGREDEHQPPVVPRQLTPVGE